MNKLLQKSLVTALGTLLGATASTSVAADGARSTKVELGVGGSYIDLPGIAGTTAAVADTNLAGGPVRRNPRIARQPNHNSADLSEIAPSGKIGIEVPLGPNTVSLTMQGRYSEWDDTFAGTDTLANTGTSAEFFEVIGLDGTPIDLATQGNARLLSVNSNAANIVGVVGIIATPGQTVTTTVNTDASYLEGRFGLAADGTGTTTGGGSQITPRWSAGVVISDLDQKYAIRHDARTSGFANVSDSVNEHLETSYIGPTFGLDLGFQPSGTPRTSWHLKGEVAALYGDTDLTASQTVDFTDLGGILPVNIRVADNESNITGRFDFTAGFEHSLGQASIGVEGTVSYWTGVPMITNPSASIGNELGVAVAQPSAVRIGEDNMTTAQVMLTFKLPIN